ncbi:hypothetical protein ACM44_11150 [Chryseobacterium koreense CCUG 49689]|uniref:DUF5723 domain-containing protein n=1 Tax=Chryseobacterium koreense CCUG 49689 TaxID=1304281 RepID=A0A0J7IXT8_9FLAO|nr:hypothetical protein ACM44_11150 [Chryseobacterium koreense CCUG 49689]
MKKSIFFVVTLFFCGHVLGQDSYLFGNDLYSGINAAGISPTHIFLNPNPWEVNLLAEDVFVQNDYGYISSQHILGLPGSTIKTASIPKNVTGTNTPNVFDYYNKDFSTYHFSSDLYGPSFSIRTNIKDRKYAFGFFSRLRTQSSTINADNYIRFDNQGILEPEKYEMQPLKLSFMNWAELGFNFATKIFPYADKHWIIGGNIKYENGLDGVLISEKSLELRRTTATDSSGIGKKIISAHDFDIDASYATNYNFSTKRYEPKRAGTGFGIDFGLTMLDQDDDADEYDTKLSFNILDFGYVNFTGENHNFTGSAIQLTDNPAFENKKFDDPQKILQTLSDEVYGDPHQSLRGTEFKIGLPTSIHVNFSKNVGTNKFVNANWIQRVPVFENSLRRSNIFNISYTVQKPVIGYGISSSLYEYRDVQFGGYFRVGPLILGSENLLPMLFSQKKLHSADFYFALKLYPFWDNEMKRHRRRKCNCD